MLRRNDNAQNVFIGDKKVEMEANAATPFRFKNLFRRDLLKIATTATEDNASDQIEASQQLAFIMAKQAEGVDMTKLTEESFYSWLEDFMSSDMYDHMDEFVELWQSTQETSSTPKK